MQWQISKVKPYSNCFQKKTSDYQTTSAYLLQNICFKYIDEYKKIINSEQLLDSEIFTTKVMYAKFTYEILSAALFHQAYE